MLDVLFPPGVVCHEFRGRADVRELPYAERVVVRQASAVRQAEFAGGRCCAHAGLRHLGLEPVPLTMREDGTPAWPDDVVGTITHATGYCASAVALRRTIRALGLDVERVGRVTSNLWPLVCSPAELTRLAGLPSQDQVLAATLMFSVKEAFFKSQFEVTGQWLDFLDVETDLPSAVVDRGSFAVRPRRHVHLVDAVAGPWRGRFQFVDALVVTGMAIESTG